MTTAAAPAPFVVYQVWDSCAHTHTFSSYSGVAAVEFAIAANAASPSTARRAGFRPHVARYLVERSIVVGGRAGLMTALHELTFDPYDLVSVDGGPAEFDSARYGQLSTDYFFDLVRAHEHRDWSLRFDLWLQSDDRWLRSPIDTLDANDPATPGGLTTVAGMKSYHRSTAGLLDRLTASRLTTPRLTASAPSPTAPPPSAPVPIADRSRAPEATACLHPAGRQYPVALTGGDGPDEASHRLTCLDCGAKGWRYCDGTAAWSEIIHVDATCDRLLEVLSRAQEKTGSTVVRNLVEALQASMRATGIDLTRK